MLQANKPDRGPIQLLSTIGELILQLRTDVRRQTHTWFNSLFKENNASREASPKVLKSFTDVIKKPLHMIDVRLQQEVKDEREVSLGVRIAVVEKRTGREVGYEHWVIAYEGKEVVIGLGEQVEEKVVGVMGDVYRLLMELPVWTKVLNNDSQLQPRRPTHLVDYRIQVSPHKPPFSIETVCRLQSIINPNTRSILKTSVYFTPLQPSQSTPAVTALSHLLSHHNLSKQTKFSTEATSDKSKSKDRTFSGHSIHSPKRTTSFKLARRLSAIHFEENDNEVTFLSIGEEPMVKASHHHGQVKKELIILEDRKSSSEFEVLRNQKQEKFQNYLERLAGFKEGLPTQEEQLLYLIDNE